VIELEVTRERDLARSRADIKKYIVENHRLTQQVSSPGSMNVIA
jgi:hypothetical protein